MEGFLAAASHGETLARRLLPKYGEADAEALLGRNRTGPLPLTLAAWLERYREAWERADADAAAALFPDDAVYRSHPLREPHVGRDAIRAYWERATATQEDVRVRFGRPVAAGESRVAVEWWTTMRDDGRDTTLPGCLVLLFGPDGRCRELREYWHAEPGLHEPPPGWGS